MSLLLRRSAVGKSELLKKSLFITPHLYLQSDYRMAFSHEKRRNFRRALLAWYDSSCRDLPWRHSRDPYRIWVSEIMLQQTQTATVIPYFRRFLQAFPDVASLAAADEQTVLRHWEGLGYYRRARSLHQAARQLVAEHAG